MRHRSKLLSLALAAVCASPLLTPPRQASAQTATTYKVFSFNDLGMHCYDKDFSVFSILPLYNVVHAQVLKVGTTPVVLNNTQVKVTYAALPMPPDRSPPPARGRRTSGVICRRSSASPNRWIPAFWEQ